MTLFWPYFKLSGKTSVFGRRTFPVSDLSGQLSYVKVLEDTPIHSEEM